MNGRRKAILRYSMRESIQTKQNYEYMKQARYPKVMKNKDKEKLITPDTLVSPISLGFRILLFDRS